MTRSTKKKIDTKPVTGDKYPSVIKKDWLQVTVGAEPFTLDSTHPTFKPLKKALEDKNWRAVPRLVNLARSLVLASAGSVSIQKGVVLYKGTPVDTRLTQRILEMMKASKDVNHMLLCMDNLYQNPEPKAVNEFYDWLMNNDLPITDDGHFLCYKAVNNNLRDTYTDTIDNSPGQRIMMPRNVADTNWRTQCSSGFHVCSKQYGIYGDRVMAVKVNPRDVLACPSSEAGKIRVLAYEVLFELGTKALKGEDAFKQEGFAALEKRVVVEIAAERKELVKLLSASPIVKRLIRDKKVTSTYVQKASYAKLKKMAQKFNVVPAGFTKADATETDLPLQAARKAAGITPGQIAQWMTETYGRKVTLKDVIVIEKKTNPNDGDVGRFMEAIASLAGIRNLSRSAITFPKAVKTRVAA